MDREPEPDRDRSDARLRRLAQPQIKEAATPALLALLLAAAPPLAASPVPTPPAAAAPAAGEDRALLLARLFIPPEPMVDKAVSEARRSFEALAASDPGMRAAEAAHPGLYAYVWRETEPLIRVESRRNDDAMRARIAAMFRARLTPAELDAMLAFAATPLAQSMVTRSIAGIRTAPPGEPARRTPGLADRVAEETRRTMTAEDEAALLELSRHITLEKYGAVGSEVQRIMLESVAASEAAIQARVDAAMRRAMNRYIAAHPRRR